MLAIMLKAICKIIFRVDVNGLQHVPAQDRLLIVANHESFLDGLLLGLFIPKRATFVVHTGVLKNWFFRQFLKLTPHIAVNPSSPMAIKKVIKALNAGENVVIFPEGRITLTASLMKVYDGPGFIAAKTGAQILPVRIDGAANSYFGRLNSAHPRKILPKVTLTVLPLTDVTINNPSETPLRGKERRKVAGEKMRLIMQEMLFQTQKVSTIFETLLDNINKYGAATGIIEDKDETEESYKDLLKKSLALGRIACKVTQHRENVGVLMPNVTNTIALLFGMIAFARTPAMLNYTAGVAGLQSACDTAKIKTIISSRKFIQVAKLEEVVAKLEGLNIVYLEDMRSQFGLLDKIWLMAFALHFPRYAMKKSNPEDEAVILFTSGSEGKPKGVVHSHSSILANVTQIQAMYEITPTDKFLMVLPLFHAFGFTGSLIALFSGAKLLVFPSPLLYKIIPEVIYDKGCTTLLATSTFLGNYAKFAHPYDFYKLRYVIAGAEKLNAEVRKTYQEKFGIRILEGYGATECAPVIAVNSHMANLSGSVGQFVPGLAHKLEQVPGIDNGSLLHVKGKNVMKGYYLHDNPAVLLPPPDGWYDTGDIVDVDMNGYVHIKGRVKRFAKIAGEMVSLEVVEDIANGASPTFSHAASTQVDSQRGENIVLFTTDEKLKREDLKIIAKNNGNPEIAIARKIIVLEEIPLLGNGKTDYVSLKLMAESQT